MPYDPVAKKAYDKERNAKMKQEYMNANPTYTPAREQAKKRVEDRKIRYVNTGERIDPFNNDGYNPFKEAQESQDRRIKTIARANRPNNGIEADRIKPNSYDDEFNGYGEDETSKPKPKFNFITYTPQQPRMVNNQLMSFV